MNFTQRREDAKAGRGWKSSRSDYGRELLSPIRLIACRALGSLQDPSTKTENRWCRPGGPQPTGYGL